MIFCSKMHKIFETLLFVLLCKPQQQSCGWIGQFMVRLSFLLQICPWKNLFFSLKEEASQLAFAFLLERRRREKRVGIVSSYVTSMSNNFGARGCRISHGRGLGLCCKALLALHQCGLLLKGLSSLTRRAAAAAIAKRDSFVQLLSRFANALCFYYYSN